MRLAALSEKEIIITLIALALLLLFALLVPFHSVPVICGAGLFRLPGRRQSA